LEQRRLLSAGDLDASFGVGGRYAEAVPALTFGGEMLVLRDDRLLTERHDFYEEEPAPHQYELRRYSPDGTPDATFGDAGVVVGSLGPEGDSLTGQLLEQSDGKILAIGRSGNDQLLVRFNPDGTLDSSFGGDGLLLLSLVDRFGKFDVADDGRTMLAAYPDGSGVGKVYRLLPDGSTDATFGIDGVATYAGILDFNAMKLAPDGKVLLGGAAQASEDSYQFVVTRLNADGSLDTGFGNGGSVVAPALGLARSTERIDAFAILPGGQILAGGTVYTWNGAAESVDGMAVLRLGDDGTVDSSYNGGSGVSFVRFSRSGALRDIELDDQDRAILIGHHNYGPVSSGLIAVRLLGDGAPDPAFGRVVTDTPRSLLNPVGAGIQSNGRLVVGLDQESYVQRDNHHYFSGRQLLTYGILTEDAAPSQIALDADTGVLSISGTGGDDVIDVAERGTTFQAVREGFGRAFDVDDVERISVAAGAGDDVVRLFVQSVPGAAYGGDGRDRIGGGDRNDTLYGEGGRDFIDGGLGADHIVGGGGNDQIRGQGGADHLYGHARNDYLEGNGGNDWIVGGDGADTLSGGGGDDWFTANDGVIDRLFGDGGGDSADADEDDLLTSIESTA